MRDTLTVSLPREMRREVARAAKRQKLTTSEYVRDAVRRKLWLDAFDETRRKLIPKARALGIYTDEDVFKIVSLISPAALLGPLVPSLVDEDAAHRLGGGREEVSPAVPGVDSFSPNDPEVNLMN